MAKSKNPKKAFPFYGIYLLAVLLPMLWVIYWHSASPMYPRADAGEFMVDTQEVYLAGLQHGPLAWLKRVYIKRGLRTVLHPHITSLVLFFTQGNVRRACSIALTVFYWIFLSYIFLFFVKTIPPPFAILGTILIGSTHFTLFDVTRYNSEMFFSACAIAALYHLWRCDFLKNKNHGFLAAYWIGLALCMRPSVGLVILGGPLGVFLYQLKKTHQINRNGLYTILAVVIATVLIISTPIYSTKLMTLKWTLTLLLLTAPILILPFVVQKKLKLNRTFNSIFLIAYIPVLVWHAPHMRTLFSWVVLSNFSEITVELGGRTNQGLSTIGYYIFVLNHITGPAFYVILNIVLIGILAVKNWKKHLYTWYSKNKLIVHSISLIVFIPFFLAYFSYNGDPRYYHTIGSLLFLFFIILASNTNLPLQPIRLTLLVIVTIANILPIIQNTFFYLPPPKFSGEHPIVADVARPDTKVDPVDLFIDDLKKVVHEPQKINFAVIKFNWKNYSIGNLLSQWALTLKARETHYQWRFERQNFDEEEGELRKFYKEAIDAQYKYLIVGPISINNTPATHYGVQSETHYIERIEKKYPFQLLKMITTVHPHFGVAKTLVFQRH